MSVSSVGASSVSTYAQVRQVVVKPAKTGGDADGDNDGTTTAQAAAYKKGAAVDVKG